MMIVVRKHKRFSAHDHRSNVSIPFEHPLVRLERGSQQGGAEDGDYNPETQDGEVIRKGREGKAARYFSVHLSTSKHAMYPRWCRAAIHDSGAGPFNNLTVRKYMYLPAESSPHRHLSPQKPGVRASGNGGFIPSAHPPIRSSPHPLIRCSLLSFPHWWF
jgi:hypothetical protein